MPTARHKLLGRYGTPRVRLGAIVECEIRGDVRIVGFTDARIPWPVAVRKYGRSYAVFGDLARAVRRESAAAVMYHFGVSNSWVTACRRALGVPASNEGTRRLHSLHARKPEFRNEVSRKGWATASDPARRAKISAAQLGRKLSASAWRKISAALKGKPKSEEARRKMSESARRCGKRPPWVGRAWTAEEIGLLELPDREVAERTGRTLKAVHHRRKARLNTPIGENGE